MPQSHPLPLRSLVTSPEEMARIDRRTAEQYGIPIETLMENAGEGVATVIAERLGDVEGRQVVALCGSGNNGGDGLVAARYLSHWGADTVALLVTSPDGFSGAAARNLELATAGSVDVMEVEADLARARERIGWADVVIDALLGTGLKGEVTGLKADLIDLVNGTDALVVAVDLPSGISGLTGQVFGRAVQADVTVTFGCLKRGHVLYPGRWFAGETVLLDIGFPPQAVADEAIPVSLIEAEWVRPFLPMRPPWIHKGACGHLLLVAGSVGMTGAACLAAGGALRAGVGLVTVALPKSALPLVAPRVTEAMTLPLPETETGSLAREALDALLHAAENGDVVAIGPGLSRHPETQELVRRFLEDLDRPVVVDADGLYALREVPERLRALTVPWVITPHPGEMGRLVGRPADEVDGDRIDLARELSEEWGGVVVLKGAPTVVGLGDGTALVNMTGNPGMATGGTGDVLTGMLGGLVAQGLPTEQAGPLAVYLHGLAGDLAAEVVGSMGLKAGDLLEYLPAAVARLEGEEG